MQNPRRHVAWMLALAVLFVLDIAYLGLLYPAMSRGRSDFACFYAAGDLLVSGRAGQLYDYRVQASVQQSLIPAGRETPLIFNHLPYEALLFAPFAAVSFPTAYLLWCILKLALLVACGAVLLRQFDSLHDRWMWLLLLAFSFPAMVDLAIGQDSILLFCIYVLVFGSFHHGKMSRAGAFLALALFKYQLALPFLAVFIRNGRRRGIVAFSAVAVLLVAVSVMLVGVDGSRSYLATVRTQMWHMPEQAAASSPVMMPNLRGFLFSALGTELSRRTLDVLVLGVSLLLMLGTLLVEPRQENQSRTELQLVFSLYLISTFLISYHAHIYDLVLLVPCLFALANARREDTRSVITSWLLLGAPVYLLVLFYRKGNWLCLALLALAYAIAVLVRAHARVGQAQAATSLSSSGG